MEEEVVQAMSLDTAFVVYLALGIVFATLFHLVMNTICKLNPNRWSPADIDPFEIGIKTLLGVVFWPIILFFAVGYGAVWLLGSFWNRIGWWNRRT